MACVIYILHILSGVEYYVSKFVEMNIVFFSSYI